MSRENDRIQVIAHRGASRDCPENTFAAFDEALRQGADGIEMDLQLTRDGVPVIYHDRTLTHAGGGRQPVARRDLADLRGLDAGSRFDGRFRGERIPTLEEVLERYGRRTRLLLEIKARQGSAGGRSRHVELARATVSLVRKVGVARNVLILCFDFAVLESCAEHAPEVRRVLNLAPPRTVSRKLEKRLETLFALSTDVGTLTPRFADAVGRLGRPILAYTCNTPRRVERALGAGAVGVMSDRPGWLVDYLERRR